MKKKTERKKALQINRETIVRLESEDLTQVDGGAINCTGCPSGCGIYVNEA
jgi:hypothetical protein